MGNAASVDPCTEFLSNFDIQKIVQLIVHLVEMGQQASQADSSSSVPLSNEDKHFGLVVYCFSWQ